MTEDSKDLESKKAPFNQTSEDESGLAREVERSVSKPEMQSSVPAQSWSSFYHLTSHYNAPEGLSELDRVLDVVNTIWPEVLGSPSRAFGNKLLSGTSVYSTRIPPYRIQTFPVDQAPEDITQRQLREIEVRPIKSGGISPELRFYGSMSDYKSILPTSDLYPLLRTSYENIPDIVGQCVIQDVVDGENALQLFMKRDRNNVEVVLLISPLVSRDNAAKQYLLVDVQSDIVDSWELKEEGNIWTRTHIKKITNTRTPDWQRLEWRGRISKEPETNSDRIIHVVIERGTGPPQKRFKNPLFYKKISGMIKEK